MTELKPTRIAMWSGPRNISTAMMRAWENRPDTSVIDEPFFGVYLARTGVDHPGRDIYFPKLETDEAKVISRLTGPVPERRPVFYQKHMTLHLLPEMDRSWLAETRPAFLIREPGAVLASYTKQRRNVTLAEIGFVQQLEIFEREADRLGIAPPVIDGDQVLANPKAALSALCERLGMTFDPAMLSWPAGSRDTDGPWAPWWYKAVEASTGFNSRPPANVELPDDLKPIAEAARPYYEALEAHQIQV
ncbi:MAG: HAD family hydrolase [Pseudomonadota bacterium]